MGCCCPKPKIEDGSDGSDERQRLLNSDSSQIKSRFVDPNTQPTSYSQQQSQNSGSQRNPNYIDINSDTSTYQQQLADQQVQQHSENNQLFEKILSEIIPVVSTTIDQRAASGGPAGQNQNAILNADINTNQFVQDMPFKMRGLVEPQKNQLQLPEGVTAPLSVLAAQPPFMSDIRLINGFAAEANACINNYTINVPDNVAFNFNPIV